ncbi:hypothetical protein [Psychrobacillus sp. L3]|uniref:hypothetical protein n=1 Tax=Psychrobacillus sp. L3 TaxID=3236891 RepID=UPI0036F1BF68
MENRQCKKKKCKRSLPDGYKHKYCENCRNDQVKQVKNARNAVLAVVGSTVIAIVTKGKINLKK